MHNKIINTLICLLITWIGATHAQPVKQWQDRNGEWHFGDPHAAPTRGSSDVRIQQPINVITNDQPLPHYTVNNNITHPTTTRRRSTAAQPQQRRSKADCASLRESLRLSAARPQQQRQQQYERECVIGVYYADSHQ